MQLPTHPLAAHAGVYVIENTVTGKLYVGSTTRKLRTRLHYHRWHLRKGDHPNPKLQNAWNKHGEQAFTCSILLVCAPKDCLLFEQRALDRFDAVRRGYNLLPVAGSLEGWRHTEETKRQISQATKGRPCTQHMRDAVSKAHKGKTLTQAQRDAVSRAQRGRTVSPETRRKQADAARGKSPSPATRAKIGAATRLRGASASHVPVPGDSRTSHPTTSENTRPVLNSEE